MHSCGFELIQLDIFNNSLDHDNNVIRINYNNAQRDSFFTASSQDVCLWYEAFYKFVELINKEAVEFKMTEGDLLTFDNIRLLHGRKAYTDTSTNSRCNQLIQKFQRTLQLIKFFIFRLGWIISRLGSIVLQVTCFE